jgi:hypothetical protein
VVSGGASPGRHGDRAGRPLVADGLRAALDPPVDLQTEAPYVVGGNQMFDDGDRPLQRGESSFAVALLPVRFHVRLPENSAATTSSCRPGSNVVG